MNYGFLIDNRKCIGCHACSVACKAENGVPLGVNRTWVKYVEKGSFPENRRFFQVTRCNHCQNPPCAAICPVGAMFQRKDGIVEFDSSRCIGCKACLQACPYDAIYVNPDSHTAAKCHFCAHRIERGLEPSCVVVCPQHALVAGDLDEPQSEISALVSRENVQVRRPEQGTRPKLYYIEAEQAAIDPLAATDRGEYLWAQSNPAMDRTARELQALQQGEQTGARVTYNVQHNAPWPWQVPVYFWTKGLATGAMLVPALVALLGMYAFSGAPAQALSVMALVFMAITAGLLVWDLGRPERFLNVILQGQRRSWLTRGAWLLTLFSGLTAAFLGASLLGYEQLNLGLLMAAGLLGAGTAGFTALLLGQCEGCDLWQSPLLLPHLLIQALLSGSSLLALLSPSPELAHVVRLLLLSGLAGHLLMLAGELSLKHTTGNARVAKERILHGRFQKVFWVAVIGLGCLVPLTLTFALGSSAFLVSALLSLGGLLAWEWCFVMAGQGVPNS